MSRNPFAFTRSPSQLRKYFACPRYWFLSYAPGQRWRSKVKNAALIQGSVYHKVMELLLTQKGVRPIDPMDFFWWLWDGVGAQLELDEKIHYAERDSWGKLRQRGAKFWGLHVQEIISLFACDIPEENLPRLGSGLPVRLLEKDIRYNQGWPERAIIDYAGPLWVMVAPDGTITPVDYTGQLAGNGEARLVRALLDFKTVKYEKEPTAAELDAQLMSQQLALASIGAKVDVVGLLDFIAQDSEVRVSPEGHRSGPHLQFLLRKPFDTHELGLFISDAVYADQEIMRGKFPMTGRFTGECEKFGGCDMRPLCFGSLRSDMDKLYQDHNPFDADDLGIRLEDFD